MGSNVKKSSEFDLIDFYLKLKNIILFLTLEDFFFQLVIFTRLFRR